MRARRGLFLVLVFLSLSRVFTADATVTTTAARNDFLGNGVTTVFPYGFRILESGHIQVTVNGVVKGLTTDYTVSGVGSPTGGNVTFLVAPANGLPIIFSRNIPITQASDYIENSPFPAETLERNLDKLTMIAQQLREFISDPNFVPSPPSGSIPQTIIDAKGDLIAGTAPDTAGRLAVGTTGQNLTVDPTTSTGLRWVTEALNIRAFGADPGASAAVNRAAIQATIDALPAGGGAIYVPTGTYSIDAAITIAKPLTVFGDGPMSVVQQTSSTANAFLVTTTAPTTWRDLQIQHTGVPTAGAGIRFDSGGAANVQSKFHRMAFVNSWEGIHFERGAYWAITSSDFIGLRGTAVLQKNPNFSGDEGDMSIADSRLDDAGLASGASGPDLLTWESGGGLKISNTKFQGGQRAIVVLPGSGTNTSMIHVTGSSFENFTQNGIQIFNGSGLFGQFFLTGSECGNFNVTAVACFVSDASDFFHLVASNNIFNLEGGGVRTGIALNDGDHFIIQNNIFTAGTTNTTVGINVAAAATDILIGENRYNNLNIWVNNSSTTMRVHSALEAWTIAGSTAGAFNAFCGSGCRNGSQVYCSDCTKPADGAATATCTGGGTGSMAFRLNGAWKCI